MEFKDYYKILQIETGANQDDIRQAYRRLVQKFHPDISSAENAEERFKEIQEAYDILKDPQKRALYNYSYKTIKPYTYNWLRAKTQGWWYIYAQMRAKRQAEARVYAQRYHSSSLPLFLVGSGVFLLLVTLVSGIFILQRPDVEKQIEQKMELSTLQENQIVTAILQGDSEGIKQLQNLPLYMQTTLFQQTGVKHAVTHFFINNNENDVITALKSFDVSLQEEVFKRDETIKRLLMAHYYRLADERVEKEDFVQAFQLLDNLNAYIADLPGFAEKYDTIKMRKNARLAELVAQYQQCLTQSGQSLLEKTPCFEHTRHSITRIDSSHPILVEPDLNALYAKSIEQALTEKALEQAEQLITIWQKLLPQQQEQQQAFQQKLAAQRQIDKVITLLTSGNHKEIAQSLGDLKKIEMPLQEEILKKPKVRENLLNFHMKELLTLMQLADKPVQPYLQLIEQFDSKILTVNTTSEKPVVAPVIENKIGLLLKQCEQYYKIRRLTKGKQTALSCYKEVLVHDPQNAIALAGLGKIERLFQIWAENALHKSELNRVIYYLSGLEKVNPQSTALTDLKKRLRWKKSQQIKPIPPKKQINNQQSAQVEQPVVKQKPPVKTVETQPTQQRQTTPPPKKAETRVTVGVTEEQDTIPQCVGCSCADLFRQLSIGVKPLTASQQAFLKQCY